MKKHISFSTMDAYCDRCGGRFQQRGLFSHRTTCIASQGNVGRIDLSDEEEQKAQVPEEEEDSSGSDSTEDEVTGCISVRLQRIIRTCNLATQQRMRAAIRYVHGKQKELNLISTYMKLGLPEADIDELMKEHHPEVTVSAKTLS